MPSRSPASFAHRQVECFVTKPVGEADERFHRSITELLDEWWRIHGSPVSWVQIVGPARSARIHEISDALQRHDFPHTFHPLGSDTAAAVLQGCGTAGEGGVFPVIVLRNGVTLVNPTNVELANALGARTRAGPGVYDLVVVGGGPAGLSAAVYAESEGLRTAVVEPTAMGARPVPAR
jgi:thioredoxin reductase (NADPH)